MPFNPSEPLSLVQKNPYSAIAIKQTAGTTYPADMPSLSAIAPITLGNTAPPIMAMTMNEDANFDFSPNPKMPSEKIVGNIIDMKKKLRNKAATDIQPNLAITTNIKITLIVEYRPSMLWALVTLKIKEPVKRPTRNNGNAIHDMRDVAPFSVRK